MVRQPPSTTRTDTLFPYPTLVRSVHAVFAQPTVAVEEVVRAFQRGVKRQRVRMRVGQPEAGDRLAAAGLADEVLVVLALAGAFELVEPAALHAGHGLARGAAAELAHEARADLGLAIALVLADAFGIESEEHTSELQSLMRIPYSVLRLK